MFELTVLALGLGFGSLALLPVSPKAAEVGIFVCAVCALIISLLYHA